LRKQGNQKEIRTTVFRVNERVEEAEVCATCVKSIGGGGGGVSGAHVVCEKKTKKKKI
jgi:hypothetical protein